MSLVRDEIEAMAGYTPGEQPQAGKFIKLNTNENPYPPSPNVASAIQACLERGLMRYPDPLATPFRQRAAEVLGVRADWILCGNGSDDILTIVTRAMVGQGQCLRLPHPSYVLYKTLAAIQGAKAEEVPFNNDWSLPTAFGSAGTGSTGTGGSVRVVFLPNPNSPSGTMVAADEILALAERLPCPLLIDEAYADFADFNCVSLVAQNPKIMVCRTLSKSYGLAGLRFGFLIGQPQVIEQLNKVKDSYNCDALSIAGATAAIDDQAWLEANVAKVRSTRAKLESGLAQLGFSVTPSQANFVWAKHPSVSAETLYLKLKQERVLVRYMNYGNWGDGLRISVGDEQQNQVCLSLLQSFLSP